MRLPASATTDALTADEKRSLRASGFLLFVARREPEVERTVYARHVVQSTTRPLEAATKLI